MRSATMTQPHRIATVPPEMSDVPRDPLMAVEGATLARVRAARQVEERRGGKAMDGQARRSGPRSRRTEEGPEAHRHSQLLLVTRELFHRARDAPDGEHLRPDRRVLARVGSRHGRGTELLGD